MCKHMLTMFLWGLLCLCAATSNAAETDCRLAYTAKVQYAPQILAFSNGWFKAPDTKFTSVDLGMSTGIAAAEALISGSADVAVMGDVPAIMALASARPCVLVCAYGGGENMHSLIVSEKSGIKSVQDLNGKRIGVHFGSSAHGALRNYLDKNKVKAEVVNTPAKNLVEGLLSNSLDAITASEPQPALALRKVPGSRKLASLSGLGNDYPLMMVAVKSFADAHPDAVRALVQGTRKGIELIKSDPAKAAEELARSTGAPVDVELESLDNLSWDVRMDGDIVKSLEQTAAFLNKIGRLKKIPSIADMAPKTFVE